MARMRGRSTKLEERTEAIAHAKKDELAGACNALLTFLGLWDAAIQDDLAARSTSLDAAYQLSRGMAEISWVNNLDDDSVIDPSTWSFYLGQERRDRLTRLLHVLADYFDPLALHALAASLWAWGEVAGNPAYLADNAGDKKALKRQSEVWHDLLVSRLNPRSLFTPEDVMKSVGAAWPIVTKYAWTLMAFLAFALATAVGAALLSSNGAAWFHAAGGFLAALGVIGITATGVAARAKDIANGLLEQVRTALYADLVAAAATSLPMAARGRIKRRNRGRNLRN